MARTRPRGKFLWYLCFMSNSLEIAQKVLALEIRGLEALRASLGEDFENALSLIHDATGRLVVTGIGKSGHVARKVAATFSSTGTSALFVHPAEASHGDLGMIAKGDIILALSKSGETSELGDLLAYAARFSIPVIAITAEAGSALAKSARAALILPSAEEACGETLAPTTSTTMMMALGDALAVSLLRARGFSASDFQGFHPGGRLGAALRRARDLMHGEDVLPLVGLRAGFPDIVAAITKGGFGCVGVVDKDGLLNGIITDGDLRRHLQSGLESKTAEMIMTREPRTAAPETLAGDILAYMSLNKITALFVVERNRPVGLVHVHDCLSIGVV